VASLTALVGLGSRSTAYRPQPERLGGISRRFVEDMRAFHAEPNAMKRDEIAARQLHALRAYQEKASPT